MSSTCPALNYLVAAFSPELGAKNTLKVNPGVAPSFHRLTLLLPPPSQAVPPPPPAAEPALLSPWKLGIDLATLQREGKHGPFHLLLAQTDPLVRFAFDDGRILIQKDWKSLPDQRVALPGGGCSCSRQVGKMGKPKGCPAPERSQVFLGM